ncbi:MAG: glycogen synthase [Planctomycetes bacterium]|nr:glycogen synthase [Planctomycetota bacterium]
MAASNAAAGDPLLFEVAWEVCQQLGGIYTVIRSKVPHMAARWGDRYCLIGPYDAARSPAEFEETPADGPVAEALQDLLRRGFDVRHGRWLVSGQPRTVLLNPRSALAHLGEVKRRFWDHHRIGLPAQDDLVNQVLAFGFLAHEFLAALLPRLGGRPVIGHFHEWMGGAAIPEVRRSSLPLAVVFTTHATQLGRHLAPNDPGFYDHLPHINWHAEARRYGIEPQVLLERAAAHGAHVFTTVSEITGLECQHLLGRRPDLALPNGLNIERFVAMHEFQNLHLVYKEKINQFVMAHFFPSYTFDLDRTLYFFTSGRYEYRNKGFDLVIEAMARLNWRLREANVNRTVVCFIITQRPFRSISAEVLRYRAVMGEMRATCDAVKDQAGERLFHATARGEAPPLDALVDDVWRLRLRRMRLAWKSPRLPPVLTHDLLDEGRDEVLAQVRACNLWNTADDRVKMIYHPDFVTALNPLFGIDYPQFVRGCHLGVFPSHYEPWGYAPLECVASGVPAVTSDLAGFGTYLYKHMPDHQGRGIFLLHRRRAAFDAAANELVGWMLDFARQQRRERIAQRNRVEACAEQFDWDNLGKFYADAHALALERCGR